MTQHSAQHIRRMVIGIAGRKYAGKDTVASMIVEDGPTIAVHRPSWAPPMFLRRAFADKIKDIVMDLYDLTLDQTYGKSKEIVDPRWGRTPREILQLTGTEWGRQIHEETWVRYAFRALESTERAHERVSRGVGDGPFVENTHEPYDQVDVFWLIPDVRFHSEVRAIRGIGGVIIKIVRPGSSTGQFEDHASEREVDAIVGDHEILNDGDLVTLRSDVRDVFRRIVETRAS